MTLGIRGEKRFNLEHCAGVKWFERGRGSTLKHLLDQYLLQTEGGLHCKILPALNLAAGVKSGGDLRGRQGGRGGGGAKSRALESWDKPGPRKQDWGWTFGFHASVFLVKFSKVHHLLVVQSSRTESVSTSPFFGKSSLWVQRELRAGGPQGPGISHHPHKVPGKLATALRPPCSAHGHLVPSTH